MVLYLVVLGGLRTSDGINGVGHPPLSYVSLSHFKAALLQPVMSDLRGVH